MSTKRLKKSELNRLNKEILKRKREIWEALLTTAMQPEALKDAEALHKALDEAELNETVLNRIRAHADQLLAEKFKQKLKAGLKRVGA